MCIGSMIHSRIMRLVYSVPHNHSNNSGQKILNILQNPTVNHKIQLKSGVLLSECKSMINCFFSMLRKNK